MEKNVLSISDNPRLLWTRRFVYALNSLATINGCCSVNFISRGHDIKMSLPRQKWSSGHDKTSLSEPNMSPPGRSKCFVRLFGDHLLFPVDDLWPTFCTIWISAWILNIEFDVRISSSSWKLEAVFLKTGYLQSKNSEQKFRCLKIHLY